MAKTVPCPGRRDFLKASAALPAFVAGFSMLVEPTFSEDADLFLVGPKKGYSPQNRDHRIDDGVCKWFRVTEHEANHNGQIKLLKSRLPGAKPAGE